MNYKDMDLRKAEEVFYGELGIWAYDIWNELNEKYFEGKNKIGPITWGLTPHGHSLGNYEGSMNLIVLHTSLVKPTSDAPWGIKYLNKSYASDVLLHEMMHQRIYQHTGKKDANGHNNTYWVNEVNRLAPLLGMNIKAEVIKQHRVKKGENPKWVTEPGCLTRKELATFPHSCRSEGYYKKLRR